MNEKIKYMNKMNCGKEHKKNFCKTKKFVFLKQGVMDP